MPDLLRVFEKCAKGVRAAVENAAFLLDGLCATPVSVVSPPADAAPVPKPGDSSPSDSAIPPAPEGHPTYVAELERLRDLAHQGGCKAATPLDRAGSYRAGQCAAYSQAIALLNEPPK